MSVIPIVLETVVQAGRQDLEVTRDSMSRLRSSLMSSRCLASMDTRAFCTSWRSSSCLASLALISRQMTPRAPVRSVTPVGLIRRHVVPPANSHASQVLPALLEAEDAEALVWETWLIRVGC